MIKTKPTRLEKLRPEITDLAARLDDQVHYYGGAYFLSNCQMDLWNTHDMGRLTDDGAETALRALRRMVEKVLPHRTRPLAERVEAVVHLLKKARWNPGYFTEVQTEALDRGVLSRFIGLWDISITIVGVGQGESRDVSGAKDEAIDRAAKMIMEIP